MKEVSVIIPIYNCEEYLVECLESIVNQTYSFSAIEVIMVNDGTKDKSAKICLDYAKKYNWKFIDRKENKGLSYTRNEGINVCSTKYIMFLDSDDILCSNSIEVLLNEIKKRDADVVVGKLNSFNSSGSYGYYSDKYLKNKYVGNIYNNKKLINCISVCGKLYNIRVLNDLYFKEGLYHEDNYFSLMVFLNAKKICTINEYTYLRRIREGDNKSIMQNLSVKTFADLITNFKCVVDSISNEKKYKFIYNFMLRKILNYIVKNLSSKDYKKCIDIYKEFVLYLYMNKKVSFFSYIYLRFKYFIYYMVIRVYSFLMHFVRG